MPKVFVGSNYIEKVVLFTIKFKLYAIVLWHFIQTDLLTHQNYLINDLEHNYQAVAIYTEFQKAFEKVNLILFFHKLKTFGSGGNFLIGYTLIS